MHGSHDHSHPHRHVAPVSAGVSLLRMSAARRMAIAAVLSAMLWLLVYAVTR